MRFFVAREKWWLRSRGGARGADGEVIMIVDGSWPLEHVVVRHAGRAVWGQAKSEAGRDATQQKRSSVRREIRRENKDTEDDGVRCRAATELPHR